MKYAVAGTTGLFVDSRGTGLPLLLLHGFPLDHSMWSAQWPLAKTMHLIAPDLRGFGQSEATEPVQSMSQLASDMDSLLMHMGIEVPVVVCGLSMGGYVAQHFAVQYPDRVAALVLVDTKLEADSPEAREQRQKQIRVIEHHGVEPLVDAVVERLITSAHAREQPMLVELLCKLIRRTSKATLVSALHALANRPDMTEAIGEVTVPTLLVVGQEDVITPVSCMDSAMRKISNARMVVIPDCGHMSSMESPLIFNAALTTFLQEVGLISA